MPEFLHLFSVALRVSKNGEKSHRVNLSVVLTIAVKVNESGHQCTEVQYYAETDFTALNTELYVLYSTLY